MTDEIYSEDLAYFTVDDNSAVILYHPVIRITIEDQTLYAAEGVWLEPDMYGELQPDWSLTWLWYDKDNPEDYVYYEQDDFPTALHNYCRAIGVDETEIEWTEDDDEI